MNDRLIIGNARTCRPGQPTTQTSIDSSVTVTARRKHARPDPKRGHREGRSEGKREGRVRRREYRNSARKEVQVGSRRKIWMGWERERRTEDEEG